MKNIYHIHQSSNSYWDSRWTDTDYYLCDSEDEYQQKLAEYTEKRKQIEKEFKENPTELSKSRALFLQLSKEQKVHASEYYYGHEWCGKEFPAFSMMVRRYHSGSCGCSTLGFFSPGTAVLILPSI